MHGRCRRTAEGAGSGHAITTRLLVAAQKVTPILCESGVVPLSSLAALLATQCGKHARSKEGPLFAVRLAFPPFWMIAAVLATDTVRLLASSKKGYIFAVMGSRLTLVSCGCHGSKHCVICMHVARKAAAGSVMELRLALVI